MNLSEQRLGGIIGVLPWPYPSRQSTEASTERGQNGEVPYMTGILFFKLKLIVVSDMKYA